MLIGPLKVDFHCTGISGCQDNYWHMQAPPSQPPLSPTVTFSFKYNINEKSYANYLAKNKILKEEGEMGKDVTDRKTQVTLKAVGRSPLGGGSLEENWLRSKIRPAALLE